jgi:hypothetical protein
MDTTTVPSWQRLVAAFCAVLLVALPAAAQAEKAEVTYGAESPQALVDQVKQASADEDLAQMAALMAPDDRATLSLTMTMMLGMVIAFSQMGGEMAGGMAEGMAEAFGGEISAEDKAKAEAEKAAAMAEVKKLEGRYEEILASHGVSDLLQQEPAEGTPPGELMKGVDQVSLIRDLMQLLESLPGDERSGESGPVDLPEGELTGVAIDGDHATGKLGDESVDFVRVDGRWYLDLGLEEKMREEAGGMMDPNGAVDEGQGGDGR